MCVWVSRGRCSGSGRRFRFRRRVLLVGAAAGGRAASPVSNSSSFSSSCSTSRAIFSLLVPNIIRRSLAMISFRCSISLFRLSSFSCLPPQGLRAPLDLVGSDQQRWHVHQPWHGVCHSYVAVIDQISPLILPTVVPMSSAAGASQCLPEASITALVS